MKSIKVTQLEKQVLESLASNMYAELGFSDAGFPELRSDTGMTNNVLRGVVGSLVGKGLIAIDDRDGCINGESKNTDMHIIYLTEQTQGLVPHWVEENNLEPIQLITE
jgi:hypothetical protein